VRIALRGRKDEHELRILRLASELTQQALGVVAALVRPGMSAGEIQQLVQSAQRRLGLGGIWDLTLVGEAAAYPHGGTASRVLAPGDFLLIDTGGTLHGYQSDTTRTWCPEGTPSAEAERAWNTVRDAQRRAFDAIRPGVACAEVDRAARRVMEQAGYGGGYETFTHRLGHGIGMQGHEDPYFDGGSAVRLAPGMTLSNEPGIYVYGSFGVRIEDIVVVTDGGADHFGTWQEGWRSPL